MSLKCAKNVFSVLCVVFIGLGITLSVLSLWTLYDENSRVHLLYPTLVKDLTPVLWVFALIGVAEAVVSLVGLCGVLRESRCCLIVYFIVVLVSLVGLVSCTVAVVVLAQLDVNGPTHFMYTRLTVSYAYDNPFQTVVDQLQTDLRCCGVYNYTDFQSTEWYKSMSTQGGNHDKVPASCCNVPRATDNTPAMERDLTSQRMDDCQQLRDLSLLHPPCPAAIESLLATHRGWLIAAAVLVSLLAVALLVLACHIQSRVHGDYSLRGRFV